MTSSIDLPVQIKGMPHWRVNFRPVVHDSDRISSLAECMSIIERNQVRMRGWYYPHISHQHGETGVGSNWVGSWCDYDSRHTEYWRFYQSTQFIHLFSVSETQKSWHKDLLYNTKYHLRHLREVDLDNVPGFLSTLNVVYTITEIIELLARLAAAGVYEERVVLDLSLENIQYFVLTTDRNRFCQDYCAASENRIYRKQEIHIEDLLATPVKITLGWIEWLFNCFGWLNPPSDVIKNDIEAYRAGKN